MQIDVPACTLTVTCHECIPAMHSTAVGPQAFIGLDIEWLIQDVEIIR